MRSGLYRVIQKADYMNEIMRQSRQISTAVQEANDLIGLPSEFSQDLMPFWYICGCNCRRNIEQNGRSDVKITNCKNCGKEDDHFSINHLFNAASEGKVFPRIVADDILDAADKEFNAGISYLSGIEHYIRSAIVIDRLGLSPIPEFFSSVNQTPSRLDKFRKGIPLNQFSGAVAGLLTGDDWIQDFGLTAKRETFGQLALNY